MCQKLVLTYIKLVILVFYVRFLVEISRYPIVYHQQENRYELYNDTSQVVYIFRTCLVYHNVFHDTKQLNPECFLDVDGELCPSTKICLLLISQPPVYSAHLCCLMKWHLQYRNLHTKTRIFHDHHKRYEILTWTAKTPSVSILS